MAVTLGNIAVFFEDEVKLIGRGENAQKSGRVEQFSFDGCGKVRSSLKDIVYSVEVCLWLLHCVVDLCQCVCKCAYTCMLNMNCVSLTLCMNITCTTIYELTADDEKIYCIFMQLGLGDDGIDYGRCSCPRGQCKCHHMACILLHCMPALTSNVCG